MTDAKGFPMVMSMTKSFAGLAAGIAIVYVVKIGAPPWPSDALMPLGRMLLALAVLYAAISGIWVLEWATFPKQFWMAVPRAPAPSAPRGFMAVKLLFMITLLLLGALLFVLYFVYASTAIVQPVVP